MKKATARYISLIIFAAEAVLAFLFFGRGYFDRAFAPLSVRGGWPPFEAIIFLLIFLGMGAIIILSALYKPVFYVFFALESTAVVFYTVTALFSFFLPEVAFLCLVLLLPQIFFCLAFFIRRLRRKKRKKTQSR
ncbi:MAG: hypothetical protein FWD16_05725 [Clostridia bacterium]|nr:hypothetical protein [Clostridia bacterium]